MDIECGICGDVMVEDKGTYKCRTCDYFFGMSSLIKECKECKSKYGYYPRVEEAIHGYTGNSVTIEGMKFATTLCPKCRENSRRFNEIGRSFTQMLGICLKKGEETPNSIKFVFQSITYNKANEFVEYCLGRMKPYFGV
jgi:hypothetical protein